MGQNIFPDAPALPFGSPIATYGTAFLHGLVRFCCECTNREQAEMSRNTRVDISLAILIAFAAADGSKFAADSA